jgi:hypothetical protein
VFYCIVGNLLAELIQRSDSSANIQELPRIEPKSSIVLLICFEQCSVHLPFRKDHIVVAIALRVVIPVVHWCIEVVCAVCSLYCNGVGRHR